ncbi:hypothetical protein TMatcc_011231 [Talaromyces marneffei ATCC 18224]
MVLTAQHHRGVSTVLRTQKKRNITTNNSLTRSNRIL